MKTTRRQPHESPKITDEIDLAKRLDESGMSVHDAVLVTCGFMKGRTDKLLALIELIEAQRELLAIAAEIIHSGHARGPEFIHGFAALKERE